MKKSLSILAILLLALTSCSKYEDGPGISFRSVHKRITGDWCSGGIYENGQLANADYCAVSIMMYDNGDVTLESLGDESTGQWELTSDKKTVEILNSGVVEERWRILRLTNDEFWFEVDQGADTYEYHLGKTN
jgi:hypothetical protein